MLSAAALQLLLTALTEWLDHQEREGLRYLVEEIVSCAGSCGAGACG